MRRIGELAPECPRCRRGRLRPSQSRMYLICSDSSCDHRAPRCPNCGAGYAMVRGRVASCTNQTCRRPPSVCPRCGLGVLRVIDGRFGPFWGCTEYRSRQSCRYKKNIGRGNRPSACMTEKGPVSSPRRRWRCSHTCVQHHISVTILSIFVPTVCPMDPELVSLDLSGSPIHVGMHVIEVC